MEKAKITFQNEDGSKKIEATFTDEGKGIRIDVEFGPEGNSGHTKGLYAGLANYFIKQFH